MNLRPSRKRLRTVLSSSALPLSEIARSNIRLRRLETGGRMIAKKLASAPVAVLFGSEKFGLSNEDMKLLPLADADPLAGGAWVDELGVRPSPSASYEIIRNPPPLSPSLKTSPPLPQKRWNASPLCSKKYWSNRVMLIPASRVPPK